MLDVTASLAVMLIPFVAVLLLLEVTSWIERSRSARVARQIALTDAIHERLGAVVAPTVRRRAWGRWEVDVPVPLGRPETAAAVLAATDQTFDGPRDRKRVRIVLTAQEGGAA